MSHWSEFCTLDLWTPFDLEDEKDFQHLLDEGQVIKENRVRTIYRLKHGVLKKYQGSRSLVKSRREFLNLEEAHRLGLPVPKVYWEYLHFGNPFLLMEDLGEHPTLFDISRERKLEAHELENLGGLCEHMISLGCAHLDFHAGNIVFKDNQFYLVDLDAVNLKPGPLFEKEINKLLCGLMASLEPLSPEQNKVWLKNSRPQSSEEDIEKLFKKLEIQRLKIWKRHFKSRARKSLKTSGSWVREKNLSFQMRRRYLNSQSVSSIFAEEPSDFIKQDTKTELWSADLENTTVVVKAFKQAQFFRRLINKHRCRQSWLNAVQLEARSLPAARPLALKENWDGTGAIVMEKIAPSQGLDSWFWEKWSNVSFEDSKIFVNSFVFFISSYLERQTWPRDFKACNVMLKEGKFYLVDHDGIRFDRVIDDNVLIKGLLQLHLSIPKKFSRSMRWRFLLSLLGSASRARNVWKILQQKSQRETVLFQTTLGDKEETW